MDLKKISNKIIYMFDKKIIAILTTNSDYQNLINTNILLYEEILIEFKELYIINLQNLIIFKKKVNKKKKFKKKNIKIFEPNNSIELINFFKNKKLIAFNCLGKSLSEFKIYYAINKINLTQILLLNIGYLSNSLEINRNSTKKIFISLYFFFAKNIARYLFKFFTLINLFPKIDYYFDSSRPTIKNINSSNIRKIEKVFPQIKLSYFRKVININSRSYDDLFYKKNSLKKKYLVFVDSFFEHGDRIIRECSINEKIIKKYYSTLSNFLKKLSKIYKKKVIICIHPKNNSKIFLKYLKNFSIKKYKTQEMVKNSFISLFHESSSILDAVILKKNIIILKSNLLGNYLLNRVHQYERLLNLQSVDIKDYQSLKKSNLDYILNSSKRNNSYIKNHLNSDGLIPGYKKVIKLLKRI